MQFHSDKKPNVIWILTDQMRASAMSFRGDENVSTPNLDNMAREGVAFINAVAGTPWCCPFRGALLTGLYPHQNGVTETPKALDPSIDTITKPFKQAGYHTAYIGKWHLDGSNNVTHYIPKDRRGGFDYFMGYENNNNQNECYVFGNDSEEPKRLDGYETDALTNMLLNHLEGHVSQDDYKPFFAVLSVQPPHDPFIAPTYTGEGVRYYHNPASIKLRPNVPPGKWSDEARIDLAGYYSMIENIDTNVGRIRMALKNLNIDRETYLIFMSDHGDCLNSHGQWNKSSPWEEAIRIPFIVCRVGTGVHQQTGERDAVINHVDIAPTTLGLCGIDIPSNMVGFDYSPLCIKKDQPEYHELTSDLPESAYLQQIPRKYHAHTANKEWRAVVTRDGFKYVCYDKQDVMLFNLNDDPYEMANLCHDTTSQPIKERLHAILQSYIQDTGDKFDLPDITLKRRNK
ncbi:MAG: hypothetical protein ATN31_00260 [Candidatus Epulonipiscioides saccharophilum]|nr:MAG: hypothetical protein ATN31_00260 [Epulopiscium sp. AS2M-Bin001]